MDISYHHCWERYAGQISHWLDFDSEELWQNNMRDPEKRQQLIELDWGHRQAVQYRLNSHGFRCDEFDQKPCVLTLGCSFTAGVGLREQDVWCSKLAKSLGLKLFNLGVGGAGFDTCVRMLNHWLPQLNVQLVAILEPPEHRFELFLSGGPVPQVFAPSYDNKPYDAVKKVWYLDRRNSMFNVWKNRLVAKHLCDQHGVPLAMLDVSQGLFSHGNHGYKWNTARDLSHCGAKNHDDCCAVFLHQIQKQKLL